MQTGRKTDSWCLGILIDAVYLNICQRVLKLVSNG